MASLKDWDLDFAHGVVGENLLGELVRGQHVEVKRDRMSWRTGRVAVEFRYCGNPSGISATRAEWWAFVMDGPLGVPCAIVMLPTERLKSITRVLQEAGAPVVAGGDGGNSDLVMVPFDLLMPGPKR